MDEAGFVKDAEMWEIIGTSQIKVLLDGFREGGTAGFNSFLIPQIS